MDKKEILLEPKKVFEEFQNITNWKDGIGKRGISEQSKINERMFVGDQWYGAKCGENRPLVRRNIIKRIGEYKISTLTAPQIAVNYTADGIPDNHTTAEQKQSAMKNALENGYLDGTDENIDSAVVMSILSDYFSTTAERLKFGDKIGKAVRNAYISGTGIAYTYWDKNIRTGLYADAGKKTPINGDINFEILSVNNVCFGDPNNDDVQSQPFIIVSQRKYYKDVQREAKQNGVAENLIAEIKPSNAIYNQNSGERGENELSNTKRVTVYTKFFKDYNDDGTEYVIKAYRCTEKVTVRAEWELGINYYPFAKFSWEERESSIYGDSEITTLIPNQIAINRTITAMLWHAMITGMPITLINGDVISNISNNPGEVIKIYGSGEDIANTIKLIQPPTFTPQIQNVVNDLAQNTLSDSGATDAALGQERPDNASALIQMREASLQPMQVYQNRYYSFIEDIARIWADFWLNMYGKRSIKITKNSEIYYIKLDAEKYKNLVINAKIDVGAATLWSQAIVIQTLDALLQAGIITKRQYFERLPKGLIPDVTGIIEEIKQQETYTQGTSDSEIIKRMQETDPDLYNRFITLPPEEQQKIIANARNTSGI